MPNLHLHQAYKILAIENNLFVLIWLPSIRKTCGARNATIRNMAWCSSPHAKGCTYAFASTKILQTKLNFEAIQLVVASSLEM